MKSKSDTELLRLSYSRPSSFGLIFDKHQKRFLAIARKSGLSQEEAEDAVQETFVRIYKHGRKFTGPSKFLAREKGQKRDFRLWSNAILRNCIIDEVSKKRGVVRLGEEVENMLGTSEEYELNESANYLASILERLSNAKAEVLNLRYVLGKSFKEIGKILNIKSGAARVRVYRAKKDFLEVYNQFKTNAYEE